MFFCFFYLFLEFEVNKKNLKRKDLQSFAVNPIGSEMKDEKKGLNMCLKLLLVSDKVLYVQNILSFFLFLTT